jgi:hypothetical protein
LALPLWVALGSAAALASPGTPTDSTFRIRAVATEEAPVIDGLLDPEEWEHADVVGDFIQYQPARGRPSPHRTEVRALFDDTHLYVAMRAWDAEPVTAQLTRRDADLAQDDFFAIILDTYLDRQSGYLFAVNNTLFIKVTRVF